MTEGKIVTWLKNSGDKISKGESIVVVESDKADMDVETFYDGFLGGIVVPDGSTANVGEPIAYIAESEAEIDEAKTKAGGGGGGGAAPEPEAAPAPEAAAAPTPTPEPQAAAPEAPTPTPAAAAPAPAPTPVKRTDGRVIATPYAKKRAKELGVDLSTLAGSGPNGRITATDVETAKSGGGRQATTPAPAAPASSPPVPAQAAAPSKVSSVPAAPAGDGEIQPFSSLQTAVAKNMEASLGVPEFRVSYTITTDQFDALYKRLKPKGVTMTALLCKAVATALTKHPIMYAACTPAGDGIIYNEGINIAVAVAMPDGGLITPVLKDADKVDIYQLSRDWADLVNRARAKQLAPDEYSTGTFTVSNLGMFGVDSFDAILPPGTGTIMAVGGSKNTVVATEDGKIGVEKQMTVNVTADHRIIYGADAAQFLQTLKNVIENPDGLTM
jgi:pyruvate dehydrogenase E2 component (dihydrolipoamide acetyltransferase)